MENTNNVYEGKTFDDLVPVDTDVIEKEKNVEDDTPTQDTSDDPAVYVNKCGIEEDIVKLFTVTQADVVKYIQNNIVGAPIVCDFQVYPGTSINKYVIVRVGIPTKFGAARVTSKIDNPHMQREHEKKSSGEYMAESLYKRLEKFMFPETPADLNNDIAKKKYFTKLGLTTEIYASKIAPYIEPRVADMKGINEKFFALVLQVDNIISEMINERPKSGKPYGELEILNILGGDPIRDNYGNITSYTPVTWKCTIDLRKSISYSGNFGIGMNEIIRSVQ